MLINPNIMIRELEGDKTRIIKRVFNHRDRIVERKTTITRMTNRWRFDLKQVETTGCYIIAQYQSKEFNRPLYIFYEPSLANIICSDIFVISLNISTFNLEKTKFTIGDQKGRISIAKHFDTLDHIEISMCPTKPLTLYSRNDVETDKFLTDDGTRTNHVVYNDNCGNRKNIDLTSFLKNHRNEYNKGVQIYYVSNPC